MIERLLLAEKALAGGQLDQAERLFAQVADADERNAMAVVGLAEVALARGDRAAAEQHARRALEIDPDDAAARRIADASSAAAVAAAAVADATLAGTGAAGGGVASQRRRAGLIARLRAALARLLRRRD